MSGALMNKVWDLFGMDSAEPEEYEEENIYDYENEEEQAGECRKYTVEDLSCCIYASPMKLDLYLLAGSADTLSRVCSI